MSEDKKIQGINLSEDELLEVTGGAGGAGAGYGIKVIRVACVSCKRHFPVRINSTECTCPYCRTVNTFEG